MPFPFIYAKKLILPSAGANVLQSLAMAQAFAESGADLHFFPGIAKGKQETGEAVLSTVLKNLGLDRQAASRWTPLPGTNKGIYGLAFRLAVGKMLVTERDGVFYSRDVSEAFFLAKICGMLSLKRRFFFEMHEILFQQHELQDRSRRIWERTRQKEKTILDAVTGLVAIHPDIAEAARELFDYNGPVLVEPSAYSPALFYSLDLFSEKSPWPGPDKTVTMVYSGRFHPGKGVDVLIEAMRFLPERFHLRIVGGSPSQAFNALREQARAIPGGNTRILFTGEVAQREVRTACAGAHIAIIPQQQGKGFFSPLKLYESLALGLPVLVTPLDIFSPQQDTVFTAPDLSAEGLAAGIMQLAANESLARSLREKGLQIAESATWTARAKRITEWLKAL